MSRRRTRRPGGGPEDQEAIPTSRRRLRRAGSDSNDKEAIPTTRKQFRRPGSDSDDQDVIPMTMRLKVASYRLVEIEDIEGQVAPEEPTGMKDQFLMSWYLTLGGETNGSRSMVVSATKS